MLYCLVGVLRHKSQTTEITIMVVGRKQLMALGFQIINPMQFPLLTLQNLLKLRPKIG